MEKKLQLLCTAMLLLAVTPMFSQVSNDNEDEVNKIDARTSKYDYVNGQVLVKFSDKQTVRVRKSGKRFASTNVNHVTEVLQKYGVEEMEQLLPNENPQRKMRKAQAFNGTVVEEKDLSQLYCVKLSEEHHTETMQLVEDLQDLEEVEFAEPNYKLYTLEEPTIALDYLSNAYVSQQWYLDAYGVKQLWNKPVINPTRPVIAIIDTGVDMTHPDLVDNLWTNQKEADGEEGYDNDGNGFAGDVHGWDFINNTPNVRDFNMHGTHVAGIAAASNNGIGIVGANPRALIMPVSVMQSDGTGDVATIVKGIDYAVQNGATVLNLSLGTYANSHALRQALEKAYQSAVIVAAAGNDFTRTNPIPCHKNCLHYIAFPAGYSFVLGVQATMENGDLAPFSNHDFDGPNYSWVSTLQDPDGFNYELKAPGTNILSTIPGGKYKVLNGTSMAAPLVAGAISALKMVKNYDTQEILWGDLLHTENIAQAYAVTNRPAELDLMQIQLRNRKELADESEEDYSNDHEIDAGETVSIYPVIRTTFGAASNIQMKLEMGDEFEDPNTVEILTPGWVDFGLHLDAYGKGVSLNPMQLRVASNVTDNRHIKMKFTAKCDETNTQYVGTFTLVVTNMVKISGLISEDRTLTADHVYLVNENLGIMEGATLTIEPGTRLEFMEGMGLSSFGKLVAKGTPEKPIVFTGYHDAKWAGIKSHESQGAHVHTGVYTNDDKTLFTLLPTEATPQRITSLDKVIWLGTNEEDPQETNFRVQGFNDYIPLDMTAKQNSLTDPNYLTPAVSKMLSDWETCYKQYSLTWSEDTPRGGSIVARLDLNWATYDNPRDTISYCKIEGFTTNEGVYYPYMKDCVLMPDPSNSPFLYSDLSGERNVISGSTSYNGKLIREDLFYSNIINNYTYWTMPTYNQLSYNNFFNNFWICSRSGKYYGMKYLLAANCSTPTIITSDKPSYLGTSREDIVRPYIYEIGNAPDTYGQIDLSNMPSRPYAEAHGIVWKVVVNGKDAQDEYEDLAPLGVGKHKFEVYFNRPMNKAVVPNILFGVRDPYTQNAVNEDGSWNEEGTIYTAYKTITGKTKSDGVNRIYVYGAEDNEYFEIPYEKSRFNIQINAAGSMATGFMAEAQMGRVSLTWNNDENDFEDAMGFNVYRYTLDDEGNADTLRLNTDIVDIETTAYTDYDVTPGETYYYMYKVLSTDLQEYDVSNVVAATPFTSTLGDANGSGDVDVADVITTVNYAAGMNPKPFIFEAADMNTDSNIDILDVVGIIQKILNPSAGAKMRVESVATYTVEDGIVYVESPVDLAGVQLQLNAPEQETPEVLNTLNGFEQASAWLTDEDYLFIGYNMSGKTIPAGKHALLNIGNAQLRSIRLSDTMGGNVTAEAGNTTAIEMQTPTLTKSTHGIYNLNGQKVAGSAEDLQRLPKGVYIVDGIKVVK